MNKLILFLLSLLLLTSCQPADPNLISEGDILSSFENQQIPVIKNKEARKDSIFGMKLNGVKPAQYELDGKMLMIYIYNSPENREEGLLDFHDKTATIDTVSYNVYEVENVLIFYVYEHDIGVEVKYDDAIKVALNELNEK